MLASVSKLLLPEELLGVNDAPLGISVAPGYGLRLWPTNTAEW